MRGPLEHRGVQRLILVCGLPVQHRLVQPPPQEVDADLSYLVGDEAKDLPVGLRPVERAVRPGDVAVKRDTHRIGHAAHQLPSLVTGSTVRPRDGAGLRPPVEPRRRALGRLPRATSSTILGIAADVTSVADPCGAHRPEKRVSVALRCQVGQAECACSSRDMVGERSDSRR